MVNERKLRALTNSAKYPGRVYNFIKYSTRRKKMEESLNYLPFSMDIEPTTACNFRCQMCQVSDPDFKAAHMSMDTFKKTIEDNPSLVKIKLQGMGEPFTCPSIFEMIEYASKKNIMIEMTSNGSLLTDKNIQKIINSQITRLIISVDGACKETFEKIRVRSNFDRVVTGVRNLSQELKKTKSIMELKAWTVVQRDNIAEVHKIVELVHDLGFKDLTFQVNLTGWGKDEWNEKNKGFEVNTSEGSAGAMLDKAFSRAKELGLDLKIYDNELYSEEKPCAWPWHSSYVDAQGYVIPCCLIADKDVKNFGNINERPYWEIWNSQEYKDFRNDIKNHRIPDYCKNCYKDCHSKKQ